MSLPPNRIPNLRVRDARAVSDHSDLEALKYFLSSEGPPSEPVSRHASGSIGKSSGTKKIGARKTLFSIRRKRSSDWDELESREEPSRPALIPAGTIPRKLGDHTVIMIGSRAPPRPIRTDLPKAPLMKSASSPIPPYRSPRDAFKSPVLSPKQGFPSPVIPTKRASTHLTPPPRGPSQPLSARERNVRPPPIQTQPATHAPPNPSRPFLLTSQSHSGIIDREHRPAVASVASSTEIFVTAHNSPVMEPTPIYVRSPFASRGGIPPQSGVQDRREVSHFSADSEDYSSVPHTPIKMTRDAAVQTDPAPGHDDSTERNTVGQQAAIKARYTDSSTQTPKAAIAPQPPLSVNQGSLPALQSQTSANSLQSSGSKKRPKKKRSIPLLHPSPIPNLEFHNDYAEVLELEEMEDKAAAFARLAGIYKQQKFLRDAEQDLHRQKIADLTAGLVAQKMVNLKLVDVLRDNGASIQEIQACVGTTLDATPIVADISTDTLVSDDSPVLDPSRFAMLGKEAQFGKLREFGSSQANLLSPPVLTPLIKYPTEENLDSNEPLSDAELIGHINRSLCPPLSPAPSMPLPPLPASRRAAKSMLVPTSRPAFLASARSRSLTEVTFPTVPYLDAHNIDEKMRRLELEFAVSSSVAASTTTLSVKGSPKLPDETMLVEEAEELRMFDDVDAGVKTPFELIIEEVVDVQLDRDAGTFNSQASSDDGYHTGLNITTLSSFGSSWVGGESSTDSVAQSFVTSVNEEDADEASQDPFTDEPTDLGQALTSELVESLSSQLMEPRRDQRRPVRGRDDVTPHTFYSESGVAPRPVGFSIDEGTWGNLLMGLMRRTDARSRASSEIDLERGLSDNGGDQFNGEIQPTRA